MNVFFFHAEARTSTIRACKILAAHGHAMPIEVGSGGVHCAAADRFQFVVGDFEHFGFGGHTNDRTGAVCAYIFDRVDFSLLKGRHGLFSCIGIVGLKGQFCAFTDLLF
jgi:hypothetical protein